MAATAPEIQVYALFPRAVTLSPNLNIDPSNWQWVHCLTLPVETLHTLQFSQRPYKWIRYAIGVITGAQGDLSYRRDLPSGVDYNDCLPTNSIILYYHTNDEEKRRMFPLDPSIQRTNITSYASTARRIDFREDVAGRDGGTCVLSNVDKDLCEAVHLVPHSKGDAYIKMYTERRTRDPTGGDIVQEIDNVRNGLFLNMVCHLTLGTDVAFLVTPNFAMTTSDIDPTASPSGRRCTAHAFKPNPHLFGDLPVPLDSPLRKSSPLRISDSVEWPPAILFDIVYADVLLKHFGTRELADYLSAVWEHIFCPDGVRSAADADYKVMKDERADARTRAQNQAEERRSRYKARQGPDGMDMLLVLPYILVPPDELQAVLREANEKAEAEEKRRVHEKVDTWMKQTTT